ncbi:MAG: thioredoxin domain-containing protein [Nitrososphaerales archaeon]|nr:thioredoxin domain-containing protein [Nitrososphaerales archaeon]
MSQREPNRLGRENSPYLLQHALNPVDWYPWGEEALKKAKNDGKPIFLSIGYSTCHWCHVMAHESFEDQSVAAILNKNFIAIKVDREERPEVDSYYMAAVQAMTGQGGWPLSVFLTPDLKPFYGGTYFPPEPRYGMPSFRQLLEFVTKLWRDSRGEVTLNAEKISRAVIETGPSKPGVRPTVALLDEAYAALAATFDPEHGGFGGAPKFPLPIYIEFMLRYHFRTGKDLALKTATKTLDEMAAGGIHDQIGGGFHRYSTDKSWVVPHFEKMLYDNALLARACIEAFLATGARRYSEVAEDTLGWMIRELQSPEGGFYSAQDADTEDGEGFYYTWTPDEVARSLDGGEADEFSYVYGITKNGNFEGARTILRQAHSMEDAATRFGKSPTKLSQSIGKSRSTLYEARLTKPRPATDTKILTSWNGLAISALALASRSVGGKKYLEAAQRAARFVLENSREGGSLLRSYAGGEAAIPGTLEDYAFLGLGILDLFEATYAPRWLEDSKSIASRMLELFEDVKDGGFFNSESLVPARLKESYDGPVPSGNSAATVLLLRLSGLTGIESFRSSAEKALRYFQSLLDAEPTSHAFMLQGVDMMLNGTREVVITGRDDEQTAPFVRTLNDRFLPDAVSIVSTNKSHGSLSKLSPLLEGRAPGTKPVAYVCRNFTCRLPARTPEAFASQLDSFGG